MRPSAIDRYTRAVERVLSHLQSSIEHQAPLPDLAEMAAVAHLSPFHFHRIYCALTGETVGNTVARLRLASALRMLSEGRSVTEAAMAVGYDSPQALARAFRARLDVAPAALRGDARAAQALFERLQPPPPRPADASLRVEVRQVEPFKIVVLRRRGAFGELDGGFGRLFDWALRAGIAERLERLIGIPLADHRDVAPREHLFDCAMSFGDTLPTPPAGLALRQLGGGAHAVLRHVGPYEGIEDAVDRLLAEWLPQSGHVPREAPLFHHYLDDPEQVPAAILRADIHLPLQPA